MRSTRSTSFSSPGRQGEEEERRVDQFRGDAWRGGVVRENALDTGMPVYSSGGREKEKERDAVGQRETGRTRFRRRTTFRRFSSKPSPSFVEGTGGRGVGRGVGTFFIKVVSKKKSRRAPSVSISRFFTFSEENVHAFDLSFSPRSDRINFF